MDTNSDEEFRRNWERFLERRRENQRRAARFREFVNSPEQQFERELEHWHEQWQEEYDKNLRRKQMKENLANILVHKASLLEYHKGFLKSFNPKFDDSDYPDMPYIPWSTKWASDFAKEEGAYSEAWADYRKYLLRYELEFEHSRDDMAYLHNLLANKPNRYYQGLRDGLKKRLEYKDIADPFAGLPF